MQRILTGLAVFSIVATASAQEKPPPPTLNPNNMLQCYLAAEKAKETAGDGAFGAPDLDNISRLARAAMAIQVVERLDNATYAGISDYIVGEMWNASRLHNQKAILDADLGDMSGIERFLTRCLMAIADTAMRNAENARKGRPDFR